MKKIAGALKNYINVSDGRAAFCEELAELHRREQTL